MDRSSDTRHLSTHIDRPVHEVYDYASEPTNLTAWAPGLGSTIEKIDGEWVMDSPMGRIVLTFAPRNEFGVLDHWVQPAEGDAIYNPFRVIADGDGSEVIFTVRRRAGMTDEDFDRDAGAVLADLDNLKQKVESA